MGESVHDGPEASITNAALCAAMQRVPLKSRCIITPINFMMACLLTYCMRANFKKLSCKIQALPVGSFLLAQRDQGTPVVKSVEDFREI